MLDVREQKDNPKKPDFICPDANCLNDKGYRTGAWLPKGQRTFTPTSNAAVTPPAYVPPPAPGIAAAVQVQNAGRDAQITALFWNCFDDVLEGIARRKLVDWAKPETIAALTATQFIQRSKG